MSEQATAGLSAMPPAPPGPASTLRQAAAQLGLTLNERALAQLLAYVNLLQRWNKVYNLTAVRAADDMLTHHVLDCLATLAPLQRQLADCCPLQAQVLGQPPEPPALPERAEGAGDTDPVRLLDVGSGGGLPGVVLSIMQPHWSVDCVDTVAKKVAFIRQTAAELKLPGLHGLHSRVEAMDGGPRGYAVITARAFASLHDFVTLTQHLLAPDGIWMAMKARLTDEELLALPDEVQVFHVEQLQVPGLADAQRCLVWMRPKKLGHSVQASSAP